MFTTDSCSDKEETKTLQESLHLQMRAAVILCQTEPRVLFVLHFCCIFDTEIQRVFACCPRNCFEKNRFFENLEPLK